MLLDGREIAGFIKERHYRRVRALGLAPKLAIVYCGDDPATASYIRAKRRYGQDIGAEVGLHHLPTNQKAIVSLLGKLNRDQSVHGIIVQLPLPGSLDTDVILSEIALAKDVDGLVARSPFDPATPTGILWLLAAYNIDLQDKQILVIGQGRLVGKPLTKMLRRSGHQVDVADINTPDLQGRCLQADILITATGQAGLIKPGTVKAGAVLIDASGDVDPVLYDDKSLKITPTPGGVGPMTVATLFDNLLRASKR